MVTMSSRKVGSPPVKRIFRKPKQPPQFIGFQEVRIRLEGHVLRHAVDTAQVALIRQGDAKVIDGSSVPVFQHELQYIVFYEK